MAARSVACTLINQTGEPLSLAGPPQLDHGILTPGQAPPPSCGGSAAWSAESEGFMTGTEGRVTYRGPSGSVVLYWDNPFIGGNEYNATPAGDYFIVKLQGPKVGANVSATYVVDRKNKPAPAPPPEPPAPAEEPAPTPAAPTPSLAERPEEPGRDTHLPKPDGQITTISPKDWLVDIAWQAVNHIEWSEVILEITENRHGSQSGATCPGTLPVFPGIKEGGTCRRPHDTLAAEVSARETQYKAKKAELQAQGLDAKEADTQARKKYPVLFNDFHSWCGDFVTWVFWKAWVLRGMPEDKISREELGKFLNREAINGRWQPGENLSMVEAYAKGLPLEVFKKNPGARGTPSGLLVWHEPGDGYVPQPGDIFMANRESGGHISIVASYDANVSYDSTDKERKRGFHWFVTLDGKSRDEAKDGWIATLQALPEQEKAKIMSKLPGGKWQGVAQNRRYTTKKEDPLRGFIDTSKLREALGYR